MDITQSIPDAKWNNRILPALKIVVDTNKREGVALADEQEVIDHLKNKLRQYIKEMVRTQEVNQAVADANISEIDVG